MCPKFLSIFLLQFIVFIVHGQAQSLADSSRPQIFSYVEQMPSPGYEMGKYLRENLHYPDSARANGIEGRVVVKFVVNEDGAIGDTKVMRGIDSGCDKAAQNAIAHMPAWKPGYKNGKAVKVYYTLPVEFRLEKETQTEKRPDSLQNLSGGSIHPPIADSEYSPDLKKYTPPSLPQRPLTYVEMMPKPGYDYNEFLAKNINYPERARNNNIQGKVIVRFVVNEDGHISDCEAVRSAGSDLDSEAVRVVRSFPPWKPGMQNGKPVKVYFTLPIVFNVYGQSNIRKASRKDLEKVYSHVDAMPYPKFGMEKYLAENLHYPSTVGGAKPVVNVTVRFIINESGSASDFEIVKGADSLYNNEAIRVLRNMPPWMAGINKGEYVKVYVTQLVVFKPE